jgi:hypothetical protein
MVPGGATGLDAEANLGSSRHHVYSAGTKSTPAESLHFTPVHSSRAGLIVT